jgi:hypothetical protein
MATVSRVGPVIPPAPQVAQIALPNPEWRKQSRHAFLDLSAVSPAAPTAVPSTPASWVTPAAAPAPAAHSTGAPASSQEVNYMQLLSSFLALTLLQTLKNIVIFGQEGPPPIIASFMLHPPLPIITAMWHSLIEFRGILQQRTPRLQALLKVRRMQSQMYVFP